ncbi:hypothetical protein ACO0LO_19730 [Undibacterium sp. TJN25]|uniref:hypothetical protein n=1 Tax=Undibacterium sp. TJN25 TaxID=3413056 RepID=UPI003BF1004C
MILPDAAVGSIIAAAIAGLVVFISTVLTKEQKTSEFRQVWIDEIRKDVAQYISGISEVVALHKFKMGDQEAYKKFLDDNFKTIHELQTIEHRIILRLNPKEHEKLVLQVRLFRKKMLKAHQQSDSAEQEEQLTKQLLDSTKEVLSFEWKRVKGGEPTFKRVKWGAFGALVCLLVTLAVALFVVQPKSTVEDSKTQQSTQQLLQYFAAPDAPQTSKRVVRQIQNNSIKIEMPVVKDCADKSQCAQD